MIHLEDTSGGAIASAIASERHRMGSPTTGMVMTLLIVADEEHQADATAAAVASARQHPMRILTLVLRPGKGPSRLDADIAVGGDEGPGEVAVIRLRGLLAEHANSVVIPLLLPDTPVVAWWPGAAPPIPGDDPLGRHAQRRITDASSAERPLHALAVLQAGYRAGDTDLSWTRLTPLRTVLASALDQPFAPITAGSVTVECNNPSGALFISWLTERLGVPITLKPGEGPDIIDVRLATAAGDIAISGLNGSTATLQRPGAPDSTIALPRRELKDLMSEELRRLDPDEAYARALAGASCDASAQ
jgi:glucose-6-phosphate dehydrogenase assembly protein OpcA